MNDKYIIYFISRTKASMIKFIENKLMQYKLNSLIPTHGNVLTALFESEKPLTMKDITKKIGKDKSSTTALIHKLENLGYVKKQKSLDDKRITYISLTDKALEIKPAFDEISYDVNRVSFSNFTDDEKIEFLRLLKKLSLNFKLENDKF